MEIVYRCSLCPQTFDDEAKCLEHEAQHKKPVRIDGFSKYGSSANPRYPGEVTIEFSNGALAVYKYSYLRYEGER